MPKQQLDKPSYSLGLKDGALEAFIVALRIAKRKKTKEKIIEAIEKQIDKCK